MRVGAGRQEVEELEVPGRCGRGWEWGGGAAGMVEVDGGERAGIRGNVGLQLSCPKHFREGVCKLQCRSLLLADIV